MPSMQPEISIVIRTHNEARHIGSLLQEIHAQQIDLAFEVIVVDSGSIDGTLDIVRDYPVQIVTISPEKFTFGYSLNQGIAKAQGNIVVVISAHCHPTNTLWLKYLVEPLRRDSNVGLVYGRQQGDEQTRYSEHQIFAKWFPLESNPDCGLAFCNNANSAIRRSLWDQTPFDETLSGLEDIAWGKAILQKGHRIAYIAEASVYHIHDETSTQIYRRYYREALAYKEIFKDHHFGLWSFAKFSLMNTIGDYFHALRDGKLLTNLMDIPLFRFLQFWGTFRAYRYREPMSDGMRRRLYYPRKPFSQQSNMPSMKPEYIDISRPITSSMVVWPGDHPVKISQTKTMAEHGHNVSHVSLSAHSGTHLDAPFHFVEDGSFTHDIGLDKLIGEAHVLEYRGNGHIQPSFFLAANIPAATTRILLKTKNSEMCGEFDPKFIAITPESAELLVQKGIHLIGTDGPSIQAFEDPTNATHEILLKANTIIVEGLHLKHVTPGKYKLIALPLHLPNLDGAPLRAILTKESM